jgi:DhnA family fructose-bisphosphate aldolase class Ia
MKPRLAEKLAALRADPDCGHFVLADAKDADMAWGIASPGQRYSPQAGEGRPHSMTDFRDQIREIVRQGAVDIMLASAGTMSILAHGERLFDGSDVTPAIRANDATDIWLPRGGAYRASPSLPFRTCYLREVQYGGLENAAAAAPVVNLGLYSVTFNNHLESDLASLDAFREFRADAEEHGFRYFLEVFAPNVTDAVPESEAPGFVNDHICRMLAGVPVGARPEFLKIPFFGPGPLEELVSYDPTMIVGVLGGSSGTSRDAFTLLSEAKRHGARVALFGRKIKDAEHPLSFVSILRRVADGELAPEEAVRAYHGELQTHRITPRRQLADDLQLTATELSYAR